MFRYNKKNKFKIIYDIHLETYTNTYIKKIKQFDMVI